MDSPPKIPVSWLARYIYCPRQLFLEVVEGVKVAEDSHMVKGTILHDILETVFNSDRALLIKVTQAMIKPEYETLFRDKYLDKAAEVITRSLPRLRKVGLSPAQVLEPNIWLLGEMAVRRAMQVFTFARTFGVYSTELVERIFPKFQTSVFLESEKLRLKGEIDLIERYQDAVVPVELKSSSAPTSGVWPSDQIQLAAYLMLLGESERVEKGFVDYLSSQKRVQVELNPFLEQEVWRVRDEIIEMIEKRKVPGAGERKNRCRDCGLNGVCFGKSTS